MSKNPENEYIYVYKCIVGSRSDVIKIGRTEHYDDLNDRMKQHGRTLYYGFVPYTDFKNGTPISTGFKVRNMTASENLIKKEFAAHQFADLEVFNIDYERALERIYNLLKEHDQYVDIEKDGYSKYKFLGKEDITDTTKKDFEAVRDQLLKKYKRKLPKELEKMLRDKDDFEENCKSHFKSKSNWIEFKDNLILDFNFGGNERRRIKRDLEDFLVDKKES